MIDDGDDDDDDDDLPGGISSLNFKQVSKICFEVLSCWFFKAFYSQCPL